VSIREWETSAQIHMLTTHCWAHTQTHRPFSLEMAGVREKDGDHINVPGSREWGHLEGEGWGKQGLKEES